MLSKMLADRTAKISKERVDFLPNNLPNISMYDRCVSEREVGKNDGFERSGYLLLRHDGRNKGLKKKFSFKVTSHFTLLEYVKISLTKLKLNIVHNNMASSRSQNEIIHHTQITRQKNLSIRRSQN